MRKRTVVLGCGRIGATMARDLAADPEFEVAAADVDSAMLEKLAGNGTVQAIRADLAAPEAVAGLVADFDLVVGAMPSALGFQTFRAVIEAGKPISDISFMAEDPMTLDELAKKHGVTAVFDCGVAPGLANMVIGHCHARLDETTDVVYYVGGLPKRPTRPFRYKAPFAPSDVIEEYTRPARMIENGQVVVKPALSDPESIEFTQVGTLEAFNTDGLRSLLRTVRARNMREKTLRYPGHAELMRVLRETGLFSKEAQRVGGVEVRPVELTSKLLSEAWRLEPDEPEFTILRVIVEGLRDGRSLRYTYDLYDEYEPTTGEHSMARTTAYPNAIMARMIARGEFAEPGVFPPETVGTHPGMLERMIQELARRGVNVSGRAAELQR